MSRKRFLEFFGVSVFAAFGGTSIVLADSEIPVPPSLMFHARYTQERILNDLLSKLIEEGYQGITYKTFLSAVNGTSTLPEKPIIISVDDLSMALGVPAYSTFSRMADIFISQSFPAVFAINTMPDETQDDERWAHVTSWLGNGIELATHTSRHTNLVNSLLVQNDYDAEIVDSAVEIEKRTGQAVNTLVLPFGNGYDFDTGDLNPKILNSCSKTSIQIAVGIYGGRESISRDSPMFCMGRVAPGFSGEESVEAAMWEVHHWNSKK